MTGDQIGDHLEEAPSNWGKWGDEDEAGAVNYLTEGAVLAGARAIETGKRFTLGIPINSEDGDPVSKSGGRHEADHHMTVDRGHFEAGKIDRPDYGGLEFADDVLYTYTHGTTHIDALGHPWYDDQLYNGFDAGTTKGGLERCSIEPIAERGVCGRGVLLDVARHHGVDHLDRDHRITVDELRSCADEQGVEIGSRTILVVRTGWLEVFYDEGEEAFFGGREQSEYQEPGLTASEDVLEWFHGNEIPALVTDTISNEQYSSSVTGTTIPLHGALVRDQGVVFNELAKLDELAADCAEDGKYDFLYVGSPLKIAQGTGSPVNPIAIK